MTMQTRMIDWRGLAREEWLVCALLLAFAGLWGWQHVRQWQLASIAAERHAAAMEAQRKAKVAAEEAARLQAVADAKIKAEAAARARAKAEADARRLLEQAAERTRQVKEREQQLQLARTRLPEITAARKSAWLSFFRSESVRLGLREACISAARFRRNNYGPLEPRPAVEPMTKKECIARYGTPTVEPPIDDLSHSVLGETEEIIRLEALAEAIDYSELIYERCRASRQISGGKEALFAQCPEAAGHHYFRDPRKSFFLDLWRTHSWVIYLQ